MYICGRKIGEPGVFKNKPYFVDELKTENVQSIVCGRSQMFVVAKPRAQEKPVVE